MYVSVLYTELIKYKRSIIPWIILLGGFLSGTTTILIVSTDSTKVNWQVLVSRGLNIINILALLLVAVITGYVFITEYHESTIGILFTYPVSRIKLYIVKCFVILLFVILLYLTFFLSTILFGFINIDGFPQMSFVLKFIEAVFLASALNFMLVPFTALISIIVKEIGVYIIVGMGYCIAYMSFINSDYSLFIPVCIPDKLVSNYFSSLYISKGDFRCIIIISAVTLLTAFIAGSIYYCNMDVYK
jgi:bacitracin transport system permease protein